MTTMAYDEKTQEFVQRLVREGSKEAIHVAISKVEQFAAYAAASQAEYRVKMGVSLKLMKPNILTDNWEMYWLSSEELRSFNVVNAAN